MDLFNKYLDLLVEMSKNHPAWKRYAWGRAQELDKTELFQGIVDALVARMTGS